MAYPEKKLFKITFLGGRRDLKEQDNGQRIDVHTKWFDYKQITTSVD